MRWPWVSRATHDLVALQLEASREAGRQMTDALMSAVRRAEERAERAEAEGRAMRDARPTTVNAAPVTPPAPATPDGLDDAAVQAAIAHEADGNPAIARQVRRQALALRAQGLPPHAIAARILKGDVVGGEDE